MSATKTLYVREGAEELWEKAGQLCGDSVSGLVERLLEEYVRSKELTRRDELSRIVVNVRYRADGPVVSKAFTGRWLVDEFETDDPQFNAGTQFHVAITEKGNFVLCVGSRGEDFDERFTVFESLTALANGEAIPEDLVSAVANEIGETYTEELNI